MDAKHSHIDNMDCENDHFAKSSCMYSCNPNQSLYLIPRGNIHNYPKFHMEPEKTTDRQFQPKITMWEE